MRINILVALGSLATALVPDAPVLQAGAFHQAIPSKLQVLTTVSTELHLTNLAGIAYK